MRTAAHTRQAPPVVCGVDHSEHAVAVVRVAATLAEHLGTRLVVVHAAEWPSIDPQTRRSLLGREWALSEHRRRLEDWLRDVTADAGAGGADARSG